MPDWLWMAIFAVFIAIIAGTMLWECLNIATNFGTFTRRGDRWVWEVNYAVQLFPVSKESNP